MKNTSKKSKNIKFKKKEYNTIVLSDIHLGSNFSKAEECLNFLKTSKCKTLILNGDIIDGWKLKSGGKWNESATKLIRHILKTTYKNKTEIIYIRGNHDDFLDTFVPMYFGNIKFKKDHIITGINGKKYYIVHGDLYDLVTTNYKWVAKIGDKGYTLLLHLNNYYNFFRKLFGLEYFSFSQKVKEKVKGAVNFVSDFENTLIKVAEEKKCDGVIVGHIHTPAIKKIENIEYMNSGDFVENCTALVEELDGTWQIITHTKK